MGNLLFGNELEDELLKKLEIFKSENNLLYCNVAYYTVGSYNLLDIVKESSTNIGKIINTYKTKIRNIETWYNKLQYDKEVLKFDYLLYQRSSPDNKFIYKKFNEKYISSFELHNDFNGKELNKLYEVINKVFFEQESGIKGYLIIPISIYEKIDNPLPIIYLNVLLDEEIDSQKCESLLERAIITFRPIYENYFLEVINAEATKSAVSAIMSRNGSHNIGSHVLSAVGHKVNDPVDMQVLIRYIQQRWDFLAQVTSVFPKWTTSVKLISQLMRGFFEQRLLLNNIVLSEGLHGQEEFKTDDLKNKLQIVLWQHSMHEGVDVRKEPSPIWVFECGKETDYHQVYENDVSLSIPGGITGIHAFYTILENFIRNSAKHGYNALTDEKEGLQINIQFNERDEYVEFFIYDNIFQANNGKIHVTSENLDFSKIDDILNEFLKESIISQEGKLVEKNWGLAEMKIAASYLRMIDYTEIDQLKNEDVLYSYSDIQKASKKHIIKSELNKSNSLGYRFAIPKPKLINLKGFTEGQDLTRSTEYNKEGIFFDYSRTFTANDFEFEIHKYKEYPHNKTEKEVIEQENNQSKGESSQIKKACHRRLSMQDFSIFPKISDLKLKIYNESLKKLIWTANNSKTYFIHIDTSGTNESLSGLSKEEINNYFNEKFGKNFFSALGIKANNFDVVKLNSFFKELGEKSSNLPGSADKNSNGRIENEADLYREFIGDEFIDTYEQIQTAKKAIDFNYSKHEEDIETLPPFYQLSRNTLNNKNDWSEVVSNFNNLEDGFEIRHVDFETAQSNAEKSIVFKRHFNAKKESGFLYAESLSGSQFYFNELHLSSTSNSQKIDLLFYLLETALIDLYIVDERFEDFTNKTSIATKNRLESTNVKLIKRSLLAQNYTSIISNKITGEIKQSILIIHLGILQDIARNTGEDKNDIIRSLKKYAQVYITSGKGNTLDIPVGEKYISFADIQTSLMKPYPEKMILIKTLMKVVPKNNEIRQ